MPQIPRLFKIAAAMFLGLGLLAPLFMNSNYGGTYQEIIYLVGAIFFLVWLYRDASSRGIKTSHLFLVGIGGVFAGGIVVPAYLISTRGWRQGGLSALAFLGLVLGFFVALGLGVLVSVKVLNVLHL